MKRTKVILIFSSLFLPLIIIGCKSDGPKEISVNIYLVAYEGSNSNLSSVKVHLLSSVIVLSSSIFFIMNDI